MARAVLVPRVGGARTELGPEVPTRVRRTKLRVYPLTLNEPQAVLGLASFHQTGAVVRDVLVSGDVFAANEETSSTLHLRASERDRLTRSPGLLAAVLAVVTAPAVVLVARRLETLAGSGIVDGVTAVVSHRVDSNVLGVGLALGIHSLVTAVVDVVLLVVVCRGIIVDHLRHVSAGSRLLRFVGSIEAVRSLAIAAGVALHRSLPLGLPHQTRSSSRHVIPGKRSPVSSEVSG